MVVPTDGGWFIIIFPATGRARLYQPIHCFSHGSNVLKFVGSKDLLQNLCIIPPEASEPSQIDDSIVPLLTVDRAF